jgi:hypothetical protein
MISLAIGDYPAYGNPAPFELIATAFITFVVLVLFYDAFRRWRKRRIMRRKDEIEDGPGPIQDQTL